MLTLEHAVVLISSIEDVQRQFELGEEAARKGLSPKELQNVIDRRGMKRANTVEMPSPRGNWEKVMKIVRALGRLADEPASNTVEYYKELFETKDGQELASLAAALDVTDKFREALESFPQFQGKRKRRS